MIDTRVNRGSPDRFGYSWSIFSEILAGPSRTVYTLDRSTATQCLERRSDSRRRLRDRSQHPLGDVGGRRRWCRVRYRRSSLAAARKNLTSYPTINVRNQSIYDIPEENYFDIAFSIGVIHHLAEPEAALRQLARAVKPGGYVLIWVYGRENMSWLTRYFDPIRRWLLSRLPLRLVYHLSLYPTVALWLALRVGMSHLEYYRLLRRFSFAHLRAVVFDQMIPRIAHYWPKEFVNSLCRNAGLENIRLVHVNDMSWSACGQRRRK